MSARQVQFSSGIRDNLGQTEVDDFYYEPRARILTASQHDVTRLEIAVNQPLIGCSNKSARDMHPDVEHLCHLQRSLPPNAGF